MEPIVTINIEDARAILATDRYVDRLDPGVAGRLADAIVAARIHDDYDRVAPGGANPNDGADDRPPAKPDCSDYDHTARCATYANEPGVVHHAASCSKFASYPLGIERRL